MGAFFSAADKVSVTIEKLGDNDYKVVGDEFPLFFGEMTRHLSATSKPPEKVTEAEPVRTDLPENSSVPEGGPISQILTRRGPQT